MRSLKHAAIERTARDAQGDLAFVEAHAQQIATRVECDSDEGLKARVYDGDGRGGSDLTGPERAAAPYLDREKGRHKRADEVEAQVARFVHALDKAREAAKEARKAAAALLPTDNHEALAKSSSQTIGQGHCLNCPTFCSGSRDDRLRGGRCGNCFAYWVRHHRAEERPRELWGTAAPTIPTDSTSTTLQGPTTHVFDEVPRCVSTYWHQGTTMQCIRPQDHEGEHRSVNEGRTVPWPQAVAS